MELYKEAEVEHINGVWPNSNSLLMVKNKKASSERGNTCVTCMHAINTPICVQEEQQGPLITTISKSQVVSSTVVLKLQRPL